MGIYSDLTKELTDAFNGDLADAIVSLVISVSTVSDYDPVLGKPVETTKTTTIRGVKLKDNIGEHIDEPIDSDEMVVMVLDAEKSIDAFKLEMSIEVDGRAFKINGVKIDPVGATHTIKLRKLK